MLYWLTFIIFGGAFDVALSFDSFNTLVKVVLGYIVTVHHAARSDVLVFALYLECSESI